MKEGGLLAKKGKVSRQKLSQGECIIKGAHQPYSSHALLGLPRPPPPRPLLGR